VGSIAGPDSAKRLFERLLQAAEAARSRRASGDDGFAEVVGGLAADDAVYLEAGHALVRGKDAITALLDAEDPGHVRRATFEPRRITVSADGLLGSTLGWNTFTTVAADGTTSMSFGSYTTMWRRRGLRWVESVHVQNATPSAPTAAPAGFALLDPTPPVIRIGDPRASAAEVAATDIAFAAASVADGGALAIPAFAADTAAEAIGGGVFCGLDQVTAAHAGDPPPAIAVLDWAPSDAVSTLSGDLGYTDGMFSVQLTRTGQVVARGTYLTVFQRQPDGSWKWILANSNPSPVATP
jgi:ketosteroid isomerase-like protein